MYNDPWSVPAHKTWSSLSMTSRRSSSFLSTGVKLGVPLEVCSSKYGAAQSDRTKQVAVCSSCCHQPKYWSPNGQRLGDRIVHCLTDTSTHSNAGLFVRTPHTRTTYLCEPVASR